MIAAFKAFFEEFRDTEIWKAMDVSEDSPWHREKNVQVHTEMVLDYYINNFADKRTERHQAITLLSLLFHDTGKPACLKFIERENGDIHKSFRGHERASSRIWESYAASNWFRWKKLKYVFNLRDTDITLISWIIENHLPYRMQDDHMIRLADHLHSEMFDYGELRDAYYDHLISDQQGRISDHRERSTIEVEEFIQYVECLDVSERLSARDNEEFLATNPPILNVMVGASGSGKSTYSNSLVAKDFEYFSLDACRIEFAKLGGITAKDEITMYSKAFDYCGVHRGPFSKFADRKYEDLVKQKKNIVVDNTNLNFMARSKFISHAKENGYYVVCSVFPLSLKKLLDRQKTRKDKTVPIGVVKSQYQNILIPWIGLKTNECNAIETVAYNLD